MLIDHRYSAKVSYDIPPIENHRRAVALPAHCDIFVVSCVENADELAAARAAQDHRQAVAQILARKVHHVGVVGRHRNLRQPIRAASTSQLVARLVVVAAQPPCD